MPLPPRAFPIPSYASSRFHGEAAGFLRASADVVRPYLHPEGPVVALSVDGDIPLLLRGGPFDLDYHPEAIGWFREFLAATYHEEGALSQAWRTNVTFDAAEPPRGLAGTDAKDLVPCLDWIAFKEWALARAVSRLAEVLREEGLGRVPFFHSLPPTNPASVGLGLLEQTVEFVGLGLYGSSRHLKKLRHHMLALAGSARFPFASALSAGSMLWGLPLDPQEQGNLVLSALMHGIRGATIVMAAERERWYGAPLRASGQPEEPLGPFFARLSSALQATRLFELGRRTTVGVLVPPVYRRLALATQHLDAMPPLLADLAGLGPEELCREETFGLSAPPQIEHARALRLLFRALDVAKIPYVILDGGALPLRLAHHEVILCPTFELLDRSLLPALEGAASSGVRVLVGPKLPRLDEHFAPLDQPPAGELFLTEELLHDPTTLAQALESLGVRGPYAASQADVFTALFEGSGSQRVLFVATESPQPTEATITCSQGEVLRDLLSDDVVAATPTAPQQLKVPLPAHGVRLFSVEQHPLTPLPSDSQ